MVHATPFLLVLSLAMLAPALSARKCVLDGRWTDDQSSIMTIEPVSAECDLKGSYVRDVPETENKLVESPLLGYRDCTDQTQPIFGFTVNWKSSDSVTVFTGQCFVGEDGKEVLRTMWLLRSHEDSIKDDWKATKVGTTVFTRQSQEEE
uniref:Avidin n=1 Tax=Melopsittacus undulatus TaxID=13146 RepID=A0A8C6JWY5_MELUD